MANIIVIGVSFLVVMAVVAANPSKRVMWESHLNSVLKFPCEPRPRSFRLSEVIEDFKHNNEMLFPMSTVLYRCDRFSGSCDINKECSVHPRGRQIVNLTFFTREQQFVQYKAENHTLCKCDIPRASDIKK